ncbi:hypothetical protein EMIT0210MI2_11706 [Priestia megaterium]
MFCPKSEFHRRKAIKKLTLTFIKVNILTKSNLIAYNKQGEENELSNRCVYNRSRTRRCSTGLSTG